VEVQACSADCCKPPGAHASERVPHDSRHLRHLAHAGNLLLVDASRIWPGEHNPDEHPRSTALLRYPNALRYASLRGVPATAHVREGLPADAPQTADDEVWDLVGLFRHLPPAVDEDENVDLLSSYVPTFVDERDGGHWLGSVWVHDRWWTFNDGLPVVVEQHLPAAAAGQVSGLLYRRRHLLPAVGECAAFPVPAPGGQLVTPLAAAAAASAAAASAAAASAAAAAADVVCLADDEVIHLADEGDVDVEEDEVLVIAASGSTTGAAAAVGAAPSVTIASGSTADAVALFAEAPSVAVTCSFPKPLRELVAQLHASPAAAPQTATVDAIQHALLATAAAGQRPRAGGTAGASTGAARGAVASAQPLTVPMAVAVPAPAALGEAVVAAACAAISASPRADVTSPLLWLRRSSPPPSADRSGDRSYCQGLGRLMRMRYAGVSLSDLAGLAPDTYISDEVIHAFFLALQARTARLLQIDAKCVPRTLFIGPGLYKFLTAADGGYNRVRRWFTTAELHAAELLVVAVHVGGNHYMMVPLRTGPREVEVYDSLHDLQAARHGAVVFQQAKAVAATLVQWYCNATGGDPGNWTNNGAVAGWPQQQESDCAVFTMAAGMLLALGFHSELTTAPGPLFTTRDVPAMRRLIAFTLATGVPPPLHTTVVPT